MPFDDIPHLRIRPRAFSNVQPWTMEDGLSHQEVLSDMVRYIKRILVPFIREGLDKFVGEVIEELQERLDRVIALIDEAQSIRDDVQQIATDAITELTRIRDEAIDQLTAIRDVVEGYRDEAQDAATDAKADADRAQRISDAMEALYESVSSLADDLAATIDSLATRERVAQLKLGAVAPVDAYGAIHARASSGTGNLRMVALGSSTAQEHLASPTAGVFNRIARRAKITDIATLGESRVDAGSFRNGAISGSRSNNFVTGAVIAELTVFDPHYVFVMVGSNDANGGVSASTYETNMVDAVGKIKQAAPNATVVLIHSQGRQSVTQSAWDAYRNALSRVATTTGSQFIDVTKYERFNRAGSNMAGMLLNDGIHLTDSGHRYLADAISAEIGLPIPPASCDSYIGNLEGRGPSTTDFDVYTLNLPAAQVPRIVTVGGSGFLRYEGDGSGDGEPAIFILVNGLATATRKPVAEMPGSIPLSAVRYVRAGEPIEVIVRVQTNGRFVATSDTNNYSRIGVTVTSA